MPEYVVETENLTKRYGNFTALRDLDLTIERGAIHGFIGPNGAGKTTTMRILSTLLEPSEGDAWVCGYPVSEAPYEVRKRIGYMPDFFGVYDNMKVWEYLDFFAAAYHVPPARRAGMIDDLLALVDLGVKKDSYVEDLSRGMKQRLCLARTLVHEPDLLILDEPASGLDPRARIELRELLKELRHLGKTILVSSHILSELTEMCTHVAIIEKGNLLVSGRIEDILQAMQPARDIYVRVLARAPQAMSLVQTVPGVLSVQAMPPGYKPGQVMAQSRQGTAAQASVPPPPPLGGNGSDALPPLPPPPPPPGMSQMVGDAATLHLRVNGDDTMLHGILRLMVLHDIPVYAFEEAVGDLEDIFLRTTRGLVQ